MTLEVHQCLSQEQLQQFYTLKDNPDEAARHLAEALDLPDYQFETRKAVKLDFAAHVLFSAIDSGLDQKKIILFLEIALQMLKHCEDGKKVEVVEEALRSILIANCNTRACPSDSLLSLREVSMVAKVITGTLLQHYRLYSYVFTYEQDHKAYQVEHQIETPVIQSFEGALSEEDWDAHIAHQKKEIEDARIAREKEIQEQWEAEQKRKEEMKRAEAERARQEELKRKPQTLEEAVNHAVANRLEEEKNKLSTEYKEKEKELLERLQALEAQ